MATPIVMPQMGYDMREGTVVHWHKNEGEAVTRGEIIADIETDKAVIEMPAYVAGVMGKIVVETGHMVPVGELIAVITEPGEEVPPLETLAGKEAPAATTEAATTGIALAAEPATAAPTTEVRASPIARRLARENGIDLGRITGTGPGGRITEADVTSYVETAPTTTTAVVPIGERVELSRMRQAIARVTSQSKREAPHFYVTSEIDMTAAMALRQKGNEASKGDDRVSVNDLIIKACARVLQTHPKFNASFRGDHLELHPYVNIAIALEQGLIVAAIPNCQEMSLAQISQASRDLVQRAEGGTLRPEEYEATFSISNMGMYDVDSFAAIIFPPNAAVLAVGMVKEQPVVREGQIVVAHRVADGAEAARFLVELKRVLENPVTLIP